LLYWRERILEGETHLLLAPMQAVSPQEDDATLESYLQRIERDRSREEGKRLLYVAATRAKRKLHLLGHVGAKGTADAGSLLSLLMAAPHVVDVFRQNSPEAEAAQPEQPLQIAASGEERTAPVLRRLPSDWRLPQTPAALNFRAAHDDAAQPGEHHTYRWASDTLRRTGTVTHAFLQQIAREGLDAWTPERIATSGARIRVALTSEGVPAAELNDAAAKVTRALLAAITDEHGRWILSPHVEAASEFEVSGVLDGRVVRAKIDRTFVDEHGTRWIIDYKTAAMEGASVDRFLELQEEKYRPDLLRYARLMNALEARPVRAGLYLPLLNRWRPVDLGLPQPEH
jgi:ATP-dependent exoDNAse (exonuclease V) beta subunit